MKRLISYGRQWIGEDDVRAVLKVLKSDFLTQGPVVAELERMICAHTGAKYCVAVANGTAGLHLAVQALRIDPGKEGITSPITFAASANCFLYNSLKPAFADIDSKTYNISPAEIEKTINSSTKLLIPVHFAGQPVDMESVRRIARKYDCRVIEDAAHAFGSCYRNGRPVGNCEYSDMTVFSFHPVKTITTGEGGAITTNDGNLHRLLQILRNHGITKDPAVLTQNPGPWYYEMHDLGFNYRLTDIQAALGISQMRKLDRFIKRRREIFGLYNRAFRDEGDLITPFERPGVRSAFHLYVIQIDFAKIGKERKDVMAELRRDGIGTQVHYIPLHLQPYYKKRFGFRPGDYPRAEAFYERALSLPLYPKMTDADVNRVIRSLRKVLQLKH